MNVSIAFAQGCFDRFECNQKNLPIPINNNPFKPQITLKINPRNAALPESPQHQLNQNNSAETATQTKFQKRSAAESA